jgi:hypothetical protein
MAYSESRKLYARTWYSKNKARLKGDASRKESKKKTDRKYYLKNKEKITKQAKEYCKNNASKIKARKAAYYNKNKSEINEKKKLQRQSATYKEYVRNYRKKNIDKIRKQSKITGARYAKKQVDMVSDAYAITLLTNKNVGIFKTHKEAKAHPELIEQKKVQILLSRIKKHIKNG